MVSRPARSPASVMTSKGPELNFTQSSARSKEGSKHKRSSRRIGSIIPRLGATGFAGGYQSVRRFIRNLRGKSSLEACAVIESAPGEECQVDYGSGPLVRNADSGKYRRTRLFVLTLGYSRKIGAAAGVPFRFAGL